MHGRREGWVDRGMGGGFPVGARPVCRVAGTRQDPRRPDWFGSGWPGCADHLRHPPLETPPDGSLEADAAGLCVAGCFGGLGSVVVRARRLGAELVGAVMGSS